MNYKLAPSLLAADFAALGESVRSVAQAGAHYIHFDVMDGCFVPNISFGIPVLRGIRPVSDIPFDVHLMISQPERYLTAFAQAGADILNIHVEATPDPLGCLRKIRDLGKKAGITIKPQTSIEKIYPFLEWVDMALVMSVEPGFGGQAFLQDSLRKAEKLADYLQQQNLPIDLEMDGGITRANVHSVLDAGINVVVAGSAVFNADATQTKAAAEEFLEIFKTYAGENP